MKSADSASRAHLEASPSWPPPKTSQRWTRLACAGRASSQPNSYLNRHLFLASALLFTHILSSCPRRKPQSTTTSSTRWPPLKTATQTCSPSATNAPSLPATLWTFFHSPASTVRSGTAENISCHKHTSARSTMRASLIGWHPHVCFLFICCLYDICLLCLLCLLQVHSVTSR